MAEKVDSGKTVSSNNNQLDRLTNLVEQVLNRLETLERVVQQTPREPLVSNLEGPLSGSTASGLVSPAAGVGGEADGPGLPRIGVTRPPDIRRGYTSSPPADSIGQQGPGSGRGGNQRDVVGVEETEMPLQQSPGSASQSPSAASPSGPLGSLFPVSVPDYLSAPERRSGGGQSLTAGDAGYRPASMSTTLSPQRVGLKPHVGLGGPRKSYHRKKRTGASAGHGAPSGLGGSMGMTPNASVTVNPGSSYSVDNSAADASRSEATASTMDRTLPPPPQTPAPNPGVTSMGASESILVPVAAPAAGKSVKWGKLKTAVKVGSGVGTRASNGQISDTDAAMTPMSPPPQGGSFGEGMLSSTGGAFEGSSLFQRDSAAASLSRNSKKKGHGGGGWSTLRNAAVSAGSFSPVDQYDSTTDPLLASMRNSTSEQPSESPAAESPRAENQKRQAIGTQLAVIAEGGSIDVEGSFVSIMDVGFLLLGVFTIMGVIFDWHPLNKERMHHPAAWLVALVGVTEAWTAVWIVVRFFVRTRRGHWDVIDDLPEIRAHYRKTWFLFDLSYTIPIEFIFLGWANIVFRILIFRHFLRLVRAFSLGRSVNPLQPHRNSFRFLMFVCALLLVTHVAACVMWMLADSANAHDHSQHFIDALYWAVMTLTTTGYGDVPTNTTWERIWSIICMLLGIVTLSTFTAFATSFLTSKNAIVAEQDEKKERMHAMLQHYQVPWAMQKDVMHCFRAVLNSQSEKIFGSLTEDLPEHLRDGLSVYFNIHLLRQVPFFAELGDDVHLRQLASRMHREFYGPAEFIFREGEDGLELYFVTSGAVEISRQVNEEEELVVATLQRGQCFGEGALLQEHNKRSGTAQAKQGVEVIVLSRDDFLEVLHNSPNFDPVMLQALLPQRRAEFVDQLREKKVFDHGPHTSGDSTGTDDTAGYGSMSATLGLKTIVSKRSENHPDVHLQEHHDAGRPLLARNTSDRFRVTSLPEGGPPEK